MLFPIQQLLEGRPEPMCAVKGSRVSDALIRMVANDYSQLPVIDGQGHLSGIISEDSIIRTYYYGGGAPLLDLTVDHCQKPAVTAPPDSDIFEVLDLLKATYAVVIVREQRPVGILTDYDTTHFFRDISEGLILVEDIEVTLRQYIEAVLDTEHAMDAALVSAFGPHRRNPGKPAYAYDSLSFGQHILFIVTGKNWPKFERLLAPKGLFRPSWTTSARSGTSSHIFAGGWTRCSTRLCCTPGTGSPPGPGPARLRLPRSSACASHPPRWLSIRARAPSSD